MNQSAAPSPWRDALQIAALFALDPAGLGGVVVHGPAGEQREAWLARLRALLPEGTPLRRLPAHIGDDRLLGGLDLGATLRSGRPIGQRGVLAECDGGLVLAAMAERLEPNVVARLASALDHGEVRLAREGITRSDAARIGIVAFDESRDDEEPVAAALADRLAFRIELDALPRALPAEAPPAASLLQRARGQLASVHAGDDVIEALCTAAAALGIASSRAPWLALRAARAAAALDGAQEVGQAHAELAARLVLAPRATAPPAPPEPPEQESPPPEDAAPDRSEDDDSPVLEPETLDDQVLAAAQAAIPAGLLARLAALDPAARGAGGAGKRGALRRSMQRGRPAGVQRGEPRRGARLNLIETLRAAAPWQSLRRGSPQTSGAVAVRPEDFRVTRFKQRSRTTTVFALDASGSSALHRLAEAKGAIELLLADCYVRRDQVAVIAFRGAGAELLLPATRSLVRAKRALAGLPGGGGTPLASGIDAAQLLAEAARRRGETPLVVLLTDGRANIARDGTPDRSRAEQDALAAATRWRSAGLTALVIDTSPRPDARARALAERMHARYLPLPHAQAAALSREVRAVAGTLASA